MCLVRRKNSWLIEHFILKECLRRGGAYCNSFYILFQILYISIILLRGYVIYLYGIVLDARR